MAKKPIKNSRQFIFFGFYFWNFSVEIFEIYFFRAQNIDSYAKVFLSSSLSSFLNLFYFPIPGFSFKQHTRAHIIEYIFFFLFLVLFSRFAHQIHRHFTDDCDQQTQPKIRKYEYHAPWRSWDNDKIPNSLFSLSLTQFCLWQFAARIRGFHAANDVVVV